MQSSKERKMERKRKHKEMGVARTEKSRARRLANKLRTDSSFYDTACQTAKNNFNVFYGEKEYIKKIDKILEKVIGND